MSRRVSVLVLVPMMAAACALNARPTLSPAKMSELWREPDLARRDLFYGPGGQALAPDPGGRYELKSVKEKGFSPGYNVIDGRGREWSVKLGPESRTDVVASRLVWAAGYHQPDVYYLPHWTLTEKGKGTPQPGGRFRLEPSPGTTVTEWSWRNNPFLETRPFAGLFTLMVMLNNWDLKTPQNALYRVERENGAALDRYVVRDLGASLGKTSWWLPGTRDDPAAFDQEPFVEGVDHNRVRFHFEGAWREPQLVNSVVPDDVRWICRILTRLTERQWKDAFRAGGYSDAEAGRYIRRLQQKIAEGLSIGSPLPSEKIN